MDQKEMQQTTYAPWGCMRLSMAVSALALCLGLSTPDVIWADNEDAETILKYADRARANGDFGQALELYRKYAADTASETGIAEVGVGECLIGLGDPSEALRIFDNSVAGDEQKLPILRGKAKALMQLGRYNDALVVYKEILKEYPQDILSLNGIGVAFSLQGRHKDALAQYEKILSGNARYKPAIVNKALSLAFSGKGLEAVNLLKPIALGTLATPKDRYNMAVVYGLNNQFLESAQILSVDMTKEEVRKQLAYIIQLQSSPRVEEGSDTVPFPEFDGMVEQSIAVEPLKLPHHKQSKKHVHHVHGPVAIAKSPVVKEKSIASREPVKQVEILKAPVEEFHKPSLEEEAEAKAIEARKAAEKELIQKIAAEERASAMTILGAKNKKSKEELKVLEELEKKAVKEREDLEKKIADLSVEERAASVRRIQAEVSKASPESRSKS